MKTLKELVAGEVLFCEYRKGNLWYSCTAQHGFIFPVPIEDTGDGIFKHKDKGIFFMRYIRKHLDTLNAGSTLPS